MPNRPAARGPFAASSQGPAFAAEGAERGRKGAGDPGEQGASRASVEACRQLAARARFASLATVARHPAGVPFATLVAVAFDVRGEPLLFLSNLAEHTKNLEGSPLASLLVSDGAADDPLAAGRMTLVGSCSRVAQAAVHAAREAFLTTHPAARAYATLADFAMWRLEVSSVRWVGGFGRMDWVEGAEYLR